jgi:hypothetical protein
MIPSWFIAVCGRAKHGKNLFSESLVKVLNERGSSAQIFTVSDTVFDEARVLGYIESRTRAECTKEELDALVMLGHARRKQDPLYWIKKTQQRIEAANLDAVVLPGIRFHNEVDWARDYKKATIIKLVHYNADGSLYISPDRDPNDPMETTVDSIKADFTFQWNWNQHDFVKCQALAFANFLLGSFKPSILGE